MRSGLRRRGAATGAGTRRKSGRFIIWVVYAGCLHARVTAGWRGRRAAMIALLAFAGILFNYFVVNTWIVGLYSYA